MLKEWQKPQLIVFNDTSIHSAGGGDMARHEIVYYCDGTMLVKGSPALAKMGKVTSPNGKVFRWDTDGSKAPYTVSTDSVLAGACS